MISKLYIGSVSKMDLEIKSVKSVFSKSISTYNLTAHLLYEGSCKN